MRQLFLIPIFILCQFVLHAQQSDLVFHHLKEADGLSDNFVVSFLRDSRGILWLGTQNGLNRFDGEHFFSFYRSRNPSSIIDNGIMDLCEDKKGFVWGATNNGIFRYSVKDNSFKNYKTPSTRFAKVIYNITCDRNGVIWATGEWNIMQYDSVRDIFVDIKPLTSNADSLSAYSVRKRGMLEDPLGRGMWFATRMGLYLFDNSTGRYQLFPMQQEQKAAKRHSISALTVSKSGGFWAFDNTDKVLVQVDPRKMVLSQRISLLPTMKDAYGASLFEDADGRLWFSTWENGMLLIEPENGSRILTLKHSESEALSIAGDFMWDALQDPDGTIWCGTPGGISRCNPSKSLYRLYKFGDLNPELRNEPVTIVTEDTKDKSWWMCLSRNSVIHYFPQTNQLEKLDLGQSLKNANGELPASLSNIRLYKDTVFFFAANGTWFLESKGKKVMPYNPPIVLGKGFTIVEMVRYKDSIVYLSNYNSLVKWNRKTGKVVMIRPSIEKLESGQVPVFGYPNVANDGTIWFVAGLGWIGYLDQQQQIRYIKMQDDPQLEYNGYFTSMVLDQKGKIWLACYGGGVNSYDPKTKKIRNYYQSDGLVSDAITETILDKNGIIWCASHNKFSVMDPVSDHYYNFNLAISEGIRNYDNYSCLTSSGNILTATNYHVVEFFPDRLSYKPASVDPVISAVVVNGKSRFLDQAITLQLEPDENSLIFKFGSLTDNEIFPYGFVYRLEGIDDSLLRAGTNAEAVYNNLPAGKYIFNVRAVSLNQSWVSKDTTLVVFIKAPFFRKSWFIGLLILLFSGSLYLLYRYRFKQRERLLQLEGKAQLLEKEKALVMYENLKQHLNPHFLFNSLTSLSSLIRLNSKLASEFLDKMSKVYRYVLKNRDNELVPLSEEIKFVQLYNDLQKTRFENALQINMKIEDEYYHCRIAPVSLQNLVENAIKHNTADPEAPLIIDLYVNDNYLVVKNNLQRKNFVETSNKQGLQNMMSLYEYLGGRRMIIEETEQFYTVKIPLL